MAVTRSRTAPMILPPRNSADWEKRRGRIHPVSVAQPCRLCGCAGVGLCRVCILGCCRRAPAPCPAARRRGASHDDLQHRGAGRQPRDPAPQHQVARQPDVHRRRRRGHSAVALSALPRRHLGVSRRVRDIPRRLFRLHAVPSDRRVSAAGHEPAPGRDGRICGRTGRRPDRNARRDADDLVRSAGTAEGPAAWHRRSPPAPQSASPCSAA